MSIQGDMIVALAALGRDAKPDTVAIAILAGKIPYVFAIERTDPRFQINNNGDSKESIRSTMRIMNEQAQGLRSFLSSVKAGPLHGRNYQTLAFSQEARDADLRKIEKFAAVLQEMIEWSAAGYVMAQED